MCDYGRARYEWINRTDRIEVPLTRSTTGAQESSWEEAIRGAGAGLSKAGGPVRALASPYASNEALAALASLVEALGGGDIVFRSTRVSGEIPLPGFEALARREDLAPNRKGAESLGMRRVGADDASGGLESLVTPGGSLIVLGDELRDAGPEFGGEAEYFLYLGSYRREGDLKANALLPVTTFAEEGGSFTNQAGLVQSYEPALQAPGMARPAATLLEELLAAVRTPVGAISGSEDG
jgi:NADH-quinone oxidoreductase subunit G